MSTLPTTKTSPGLTVENAKVLVYGPPGIGKTTLASQIHESTLILATEPGTGGIEAFVRPVSSWEDFLEAATDLINEEHEFEMVAVDTADELFRMCQDFIMRREKVGHPSDLEWGKGWQLVADEWRLRVGKLCSLGLGVVFTSHSKEVEVKKRTGAITVIQPTLAGKAGEFLMGFVDFIVFATSESTDTGERRLLRTRPSENWIAKGRVPLLDPLPLNGELLADAITDASDKAQGKTPVAA